MNYKTLNLLKVELHKRLIKGCEDSVEIIKNNTPIDTKRLYETTRVEEASLLRAKIMIGGMRLRGILREQNLERNVNYAIFVERKYQYVRQVLSNIESAIISKF